MIETIYEVELIPVTIKLSPAAERRREQLLEQGRCLGCERELLKDETGKVIETVRCGQCAACYSATRRRLAKRRVTKSELIREGLMLKAGKGGRPATNAYTKRLAERER